MAKLPNGDSAIIDPRKLTDYLLSPTHRHGAPKSQFFTTFGFSRAQPDVLATALLRHARMHQAVVTERTVYGVIYEVSGALQTPDGRNPAVRVIWIIRHDEERPRLVTAIPSEVRAP